MTGRPLFRRMSQRAYHVTTTAGVGAAAWAAGEGGEDDRVACEIIVRFRASGRAPPVLSRGAEGEEKRGRSCSAQRRRAGLGAGEQWCSLSLDEGAGSERASQMGAL